MNSWKSWFAERQIMGEHIDRFAEELHQSGWTPDLASSAACQEFLLEQRNKHFKWLAEHRRLEASLKLLRK